MKTLKKALTIAIAFNLIALLTNGCCCFCKKHCPPQCAKCKELIVDGNFEEPQMLGTPTSANPAHLAPLANPPTFSFGPAASLGYDGWWHISPGLDATTPCVATLVLNNGTPQKPLLPNPDPNGLGYPTANYNTPDGNQFVTLAWSDTNFVVTTLSQDITNSLQPGKTYHLSFLQSACNTNQNFGYSNTGMVLVALSPTSGGPDIYNKTFSVPPFSNWKKQSDSITIKPSDLAQNPKGLFTIKFSNIDEHVARTAQPYAFIDAVSLCDPN